MAGLREGLEFELTAGGEAVDTSGNDHSLTVTGPTLEPDRNGRPDSAYYFDGIDDRIEIDSVIGTLTSDTEGSWSFWIRPDDLNPGTGICPIAFGDANDDSLLIVEITGGGGAIRFLCRDAAVAASNRWYVDTTGQPLTEGNWHHVCVVQDGVQPIIYVDGIEPAQSNGAANDLTYWFSQFSGGLDEGRIGTLNYDSLGEINDFEGALDDIRIYSRALSATEVRRLYAEQFDDYYQLKDAIRVEMLLDGQSYDSSGKLYEGGSFGTYTQTDGILGAGTARSFAGNTSDYTNIPSEILTDAGSDEEGAWEVWARFADTPSSPAALMSIGDANQYTAIYLWVNTNGNINCGAYLNGSSTANNRFSMVSTSDHITPNADEWMHIVLVQPNDGGGPNLYINGSEVTFNASGSGNNDLNFWIADDNEWDAFQIGRRDFNSNPDIPFEDDISLVRVWSRVLTGTEIQYLYDLGKNGRVFSINRNNRYSGVSSNGIISRFDQTIYSASTVYDSAGGNHATRNGGDIRRLPDGHYCSQLNGSSAYLEIDDVLTDLATTTEGTWSVWVRPHGSNGADQIIAFGDTDALLTIRLYYDVSAAEVFAQANNDWVINSNVEADTDRWMHIVLVHNGTRPDIYIDGVKAASTDVSAIDLTVWFNDYSNLDNGRIGELAYNSGTFGHLDGEVGEVIFFDRALGDDEIYQLYKDTYIE